MRASETVGIRFLAIVALSFVFLSASRPPVDALQTTRDSSPEVEELVHADQPDTEPFWVTMTDVLNLIVESIGSPPAFRNRSDWNDVRFQELVQATHPRDVSFLLATVPDYVDSNTAWMADEILGAIQAAMPYKGYVLDRFSLPDAPQTTPPAPSTESPTDTNATRTSPKTDVRPETVRLHESKPGALIFRADTGWYVVLIALETPTSGVHVRALENAVRLVALWQRQSTPTPPADPELELRLVGPTFSGSVDSLTTSLAALIRGRFTRLLVTSGSATDDHNADSSERSAISSDRRCQGDAHTLRRCTRTLRPRTTSTGSFGG